MTGRYSTLNICCVICAFVGSCLVVMAARRKNRERSGLTQAILVGALTGFLLILDDGWEGKTRPEPFYARIIIGMLAGGLGWGVTRIWECWRNNE